MSYGRVDIRERRNIMAMNGIDIASFQTGINLSVVPCDFVIVKATEGTGYVNPDFTRAYAQAKNAGKKQITSLIESENV